MTYLEAFREASRQLSVSGPRSARVDLPNGGYVIASLYDGEDIARDAAGRDMLGRIESAAIRERTMA
jgi:hypothetical protein